jgi:hypothetical protein
VTKAKDFVAGRELRRRVSWTNHGRRRKFAFTVSDNTFAELIFKVVRADSSLPFGDPNALPVRPELPCRAGR